MGGLEGFLAGMRFFPFPSAPLFLLGIVFFFFVFFLLRREWRIGPGVRCFLLFGETVWYGGVFFLFFLPLHYFFAALASVSFIFLPSAGCRSGFSSSLYSWKNSPPGWKKKPVPDRLRDLFGGVTALMGLIRSSRYDTPPAVMVD